VSGRRPIRVLVSARDTGAARQSRALVDACLDAGWNLRFRVLAQAPAAAVFEGCGAPTRRVGPGTALPSLVSSTFDQFAPDFALVGLSGFGEGIDEAVLAYARRQGVPTGAIQDYWGYLGPVGATRHPDVFFVLDERARELTVDRTRGMARIVVTGSPKHERYRPRVAAWTRRAPGAERVPRVVFFLQPAEVPGLVDNVALFLAALTRVTTPLTAALRRHPSDPVAAYLPALLAETTIAPAIVEADDGEVETEIGGADLVASCFSSVGLDHNYMQFYADRALGSVVYVTAGAAIKSFMRDTIGAERVPGAEVGMGSTFETVDDLAGWMERTLTDERERGRYRRAVRENFAAGRSPSAEIAAYLEHRRWEM